MQSHNATNRINATSAVTKLTQCPVTTTSTCTATNPFLCLTGDARGGCAGDPQIWASSPACSSYCNVKAPRQQSPNSPNSPNPPSATNNPPKTNTKMATCPFGLMPACGTGAPYQCISGEALNGCAVDASTWESSPACSSYCDTNSSRTPIPNARDNRSIRVVNKCPTSIWIGTHGANDIPENGGFQLTSGDARTMQVPGNWTAGRIWARTGCVPGPNNTLQCETGDCNSQMYCRVTGDPPASLAEFTLSSDPSLPDYYDISLVDGYNLPISIRPSGPYSQVSNPDLGSYNCGTAGCRKFDMSKCPPELTIRGKSGDYCASICTAVNNPARVQDAAPLRNVNRALVCCSCDCGPDCGCESSSCKYGCSPYDVDPNHKGGKCNVGDWPIASNGMRYNEIFKTQCPDAYSWQFDDPASTYQCMQADYEVTFCG